MVLLLERLPRPVGYWRVGGWPHLLLQGTQGSKVKKEPHEAKSLFLKQGCNSRKSTIIRDKGKRKEDVHSRSVCVHQRLIHGLQNPCLCHWHLCGPRLVTSMAVLRFFICKTDIVICLLHWVAVKSTSDHICKASGPM